MKLTTTQKQIISEIEKTNNDIYVLSNVRQIGVTTAINVYSISKFLDGKNVLFVFSNPTLLSINFKNIIRFLSDVVGHDQLKISNRIIRLNGSKLYMKFTYSTPNQLFKIFDLHRGMELPDYVIFDTYSNSDPTIKISSNSFKRYTYNNPKFVMAETCEIYYNMFYSDVGDHVFRISKETTKQINLNKYKFLNDEKS